MRTPLIALLAGVVLVAGCMPRTGRSAVARLSPATLDAADSGVVVLSVGTEKKRRAHYTEMWVYDRDAQRGARPSPELVMDMVGMRGDFEGHHGSVNAFPLAPGRYGLRPSRHLTLHQTAAVLRFRGAGG